MTEKNINIKESVKMEDINIQAREAVIKTANTMATSGNTIFFESVIFESTKSTIDLYEYVKGKKLKNWSLIKGAISRAVNAGCMAWYMLLKVDGLDIEALKTGTHDERLHKIQEALKNAKISMNKAYAKFKEEKNQENGTEQQPEEQQPSEQQPEEQQPSEQQPEEQQPTEAVGIPSERFNEQLILLTQKFEEDLSAVEMYKILSAQAEFYKKKLTKKQLEKLEKAA